MYADPAALVSKVGNSEVLTTKTTTTETTVTETTVITQTSNEVEKIYNEWTLCNTADYPLYDPYYFDDYCADYPMCLRVWNDDCSPNYAIGLTEENVEIVYSSAVITPALIAFWIMMVLVVAELACLDYTENDYYLCTMGIFGEQRLENPIEDMVIEN